MRHRVGKKAEAKTGGMFQGAPEQQRDPSTMALPEMQHGFQTIVDDLFAGGYDAQAEYEAVRQRLTITDALTPQRLQQAANEQEDLADRAFRLYVVAKVEVKQYERELEPAAAAFRAKAHDALEDQKANKLRTKQITDADVVAKIAQDYPDEWTDIQVRRERAKALVEQLQNLAMLAGNRCNTLRAMLNPKGRL